MNTNFNMNTGFNTSVNTNVNTSVNTGFDRTSFLRPINTSQSIPVKINHEHYDNTSFDVERSFLNTRSSNSRSKNNETPVQSSFQTNYYMTNFFSSVQEDHNHYLPRNPTNTRRDCLEKSRQLDSQDFMKFQGNDLGHFNDLKAESTRKVKNDINSTSYVSMPRTLAIPKENI